MVKRSAQCISVCLLIVLAFGFTPSKTVADTLQSSHYQFDESVLGGGGLSASSSSNYQVSDSIGEAAVGGSNSAGFGFNGGNKTSADPTLSFAINTSLANFGSFSPALTATATASFSVSDYTSYGYVVQILGNAPQNGSHTIPALATTSPSQTGTEQFGMNLVANTSPTSLGANPVYGPNGVGAASSNYGTANNYRYVSGETIAASTKSSGQTTYTASYIINVTSLTPGGQYSSNQTLICTGTY
jgi:hypothetical protein